jgi:hypothetical protein
MALEPFASVDDYRARYESADSDARILVKLTDASNQIRREFGGDVPTDELWLANALTVACELASSALNAPQGGVSQLQQTAGSYTGQLTFSNPEGRLYLTKAQRTMLGLEDMVVGYARLGG